MGPFETAKETIEIIPRLEIGQGTYIPALIMTTDEINAHKQLPLAIQRALIATQTTARGAIASACRHNLDYNFACTQNGLIFSYIVGGDEMSDVCMDWVFVDIAVLLKREGAVNIIRSFDRDTVEHYLKQIDFLIEKITSLEIYKFLLKGLANLSQNPTLSDMYNLPLDSNIDDLLLAMLSDSETTVLAEDLYAALNIYMFVKSYGTINIDDKAEADLIRSSLQHLKSLLRS